MTTSPGFRASLSLADALTFRVETDPVPHGVMALVHDGVVVHTAAVLLGQLRGAHLALGCLLDELEEVSARTPPPPADNRPVAVVGGRMGSREDLENALAGRAP